MLDIEHIRKKWKAGSYEISLHARKRMGVRQITLDEIGEVLEKGEIIEQYPNDKPYPSCLIFGAIRKGFPLYVVCALSHQLHLITAHWMDPAKWLDPKTRRDKYES